MHADTRRHLPRIIALGIIAVLLAATAIAVWVQLTPEERTVFRTVVTEHPALIISAAFLFPLAVVIGVNWVFGHYIEPLRKLVDDIKVMDLVNPSHRLTVQGGGDIERLAAAVNQVLDRAQSLRESAREAMQRHGESAAHDEHTAHHHIATHDQPATAASTAATNHPDTPLVRLSCTAFDTEATGLQPSAGDEIIAIGAVRIVNGRMHQEERFDQLVDPRRRVSEESLRIHGIDDEMLAGGATIDVVLPRFAAFAGNTVLVAHNAAFDMRLFELKRELTGITFAGPVLDTMLLSSVVHPHHEDHTLEGLAKRLGVPVVGRHTALGDALMTGEVFLKLLPLLADKGIVTLRQATDACARSPLAGLKY